MAYIIISLILLIITLFVVFLIDSANEDHSFKQESFRTYKFDQNNRHQNQVNHNNAEDIIRQREDLIRKQRIRLKEEALREEELRLKNEVIAKSVILKKSDDISKKYCFYNIENTYTFTKYFKNLAKFERINYERELIDCIKDNKVFLEDKLYKSSENQKKYSSYLKELDSIFKSNKIQWEFSVQAQYEKELFLDIRNQNPPVCNIEITINNIYTSPKGEKTKSSSKIFQQYDIHQAFLKISHHNQSQKAKENERAKMNDSLRYDILKRDGFKCVICGASVEDGVKLHVDHIIPISKGGKTVKSNLRTLCSNCNLGKSNKYDPYGPN